jgi:diguanylate cyclase (GGDEF)-like protein
VTQVVPALEVHWMQEFCQVARSGKAVTFEGHLQETGRWYRVIAYCPESGKLAAVIEDISELKAAQEKLQHLAYHDVLTGLPNRALFADRLQLALAQAARNGAQLAVAYLDLDKFKPVNDTYGHGVGDRLLIDVAKRLKDAMRSGDTVSRLGGDEFALLFAELKDESQMPDLLTRLITLIGQPYFLAGHTINISISLGYTVYPNDTSEPDALMRQADEALYEAKAAGRNCHRRYERRAPNTTAESAAAPPSECRAVSPPARADTPPPPHRPE